MHKPMWWLIAISCVLVGIVAACSNEVIPADNGGITLYHGATKNLAVSPDSFLAKVGCTRSTTAKAGTILIPLDSGGRVQFDCAGANKDSVARAIHSYRAVVHTVGGASLQACGDSCVYPGYWGFTGITYYCFPVWTEHGGLEGDNWTLYTIGNWDQVACWSENAYGWIPGSDGEGPPAGGGNRPTGPDSNAVIPPTLDGIALSPGNQDLATGATGAVSISGTYSDGSAHSINLTDHYTSSDNSVATVSGTGVVTAVGPGFATIVARYTTSSWDYSAMAEISVSSPIEPDDSTTVDAFDFGCDKADSLSGCTGPAASHGQMKQIRDAMAGVAFTNIPVCDSIRQVLQAMDTTQFRDYTSTDDGVTVAESSWSSAITDPLQRAKGMAIMLHGLWWNLNPKHSPQQTLAHEALHPLRNVRGSSNPRDAAEKALDSVANSCVIGHR